MTGRLDMQYDSYSVRANGVSIHKPHNGKLGLVGRHFVHWCIVSHPVINEKKDRIMANLMIFISVINADSDIQCK
jgi:hypothetical protein